MNEFRSYVHKKFHERITSYMVNFISWSSVRFVGVIKELYFGVIHRREVKSEKKVVYFLFKFYFCHMK